MTVLLHISNYYFWLPLFFLFQLYYKLMPEDFKGMTKETFGITDGLMHF